MPTFSSTSSTTHKSTTSQTQQPNNQASQAKVVISSASATTSKDTGIGWGDSYSMHLSKLRGLSFDREVVAEMLADLGKAAQAYDSSEKIPEVNSPGSLLAARVAEQGVAGTAVKSEPHPPLVEEPTPTNPDDKALSQMSAIS
jgi:hypothetical protein